jgi:PAS domain S-box-containing protein
MESFSLVSHPQPHDSELLVKWCSQPWPCLALEMDEGRILHINEPAAEFYGYNADSLIGLPISTLFKGASVNAFEKEIRGLEGPSHFCGVWEHKARCGGRLLVEIDATCLFYDSQKVCLLSVSEVAGPRAMAFRLERAQTKFETIYNFAVDGIYQSTPDGRLLSANPAFARLLGYADADEVVKCLFPLQERLYVDQSRRELFMKILDRDGAAHNLEFEAYRKDGSKIWLSFNARSVKNSNAQTIYYEGFVQDITDRKKMQTRLEKAMKDLKQSNKELERFAYVASHDLQEPLRTIASYVMLLKARYREALDEPAKEFIDFAVGGVDRMRQLIEDLLLYSSLERRKKEIVPVDLEAVIQSVLQDLSEAIERCGATIEKCQFPTIPCDSAQMRQLFSNLISNALKYRANRKICVRLRSTEFEQKFRFDVVDNGQGFDKKYSKCIFETFKRLHGSEYPGTGMGLAICKKIVERHGGNIWATSKEGKGSTFSIELPKTISPDFI